MKALDAEYAMYDPSAAYADGLFRPLQRGERKRTKLDVRTQFNDVRVRFVAYDPLGVAEQSVLLALVALASQDMVDLTPDSTTDLALALRSGLKLKGDARQASTLMVHTTVHALCRAIGISASGGVRGGRAQVEAALDRLAFVAMVVDYAGWHGQMHLLHSETDPKGGIVVAINPRMASVILGGQYVRVDLQERLKLKGEVARLLHAWLSAWVAPGHIRRASLDALAAHVWQGEARAGTDRKRRFALRAALTEIGKLAAWTVTVKGTGCTVARVSTPRSNGNASSRAVTR